MDIATHAAVLTWCYLRAPRLTGWTLRAVRWWRDRRRDAHGEFLRDIAVPPCGARGKFPGDPAFAGEMRRWLTDKRFEEQALKDAPK